ncbi:hypothetical protein DXG03_008668 [Asterophora parasitica]|uniref:Uncharacterized protein n=1 Tax=Asterophora parasitica TaxID=117018 RepID=A0A9P7K907_9AGAR|nr:hypothetical protein DXG03_008668 [Asterophora parasitica]
MPILPIATIPNGQRPWVMAYVKPQQDFTVTLCSDVAQDLNIQVLNVEQGDWNQHHPDWSIKNHPPSTKTQRLVEWLHKQGFSLLNGKGISTYFKHQA